jgi:hypothetical protein
MAIDQTPLSNHIMEQMQAIEGDPEISDDAEIGAIITLVEIIGPQKPDGSRARGFRVRSNVPPHPAIGMLEEAKTAQLSMILGA